MKPLIQLIIGTTILALSTFILGGCTESSNELNRAEYTKQIQQWQQKRVAGLQSENGWLTLCGLFWLKEGENKFGSDSSNEIIFPPGKASKYAGSIWLESGKLRLTAPRNAGVRYNDSVVTSLPIQSDEVGRAKPTILTLNTLSFHVIQRGEQLGVRVKDKDNPNRLNFKGLDFFPIDPDWRIEAKFEPYVPPKIVTVANIIGTISNDTCTGTVVFERDGKTHRIDVFFEEDEMLVMFSDETSGKETYGPGRQLYASLPDSSGAVLLDFNKAYNWPCAYTDFATCPIPPRQNYLAFRVEAGEKKYPGGSH